jgi:hypothetical protein
LNSGRDNSYVALETLGNLWREKPQARAMQFTTIFVVRERRTQMQLKPVSKWFGLTSVAAALAGCASGPAFQPVAAVPDKAVVYVYRPKQIMGWGGLIPVNSTYRVCPNGQDCVDLSQGGYCVFKLPPGTNVFTSSLESINLTYNWIHGHETLCVTNLQASNTYYLKFRVGALQAKVDGVDPEKGAQELTKYKNESP